MIRLLQYVIVVNSLLLVGQCVRVIATYSAVYHLTPDKHRRQLPLHVWLIATSYLIFVLATTFYLFVNGAPNALGRAIFYGTAGLIGQYALWQVLQYDRRRYSRLTNFTDDSAY